MKREGEMKFGRANADLRERMTARSGEEPPGAGKARGICLLVPFQLDELMITDTNREATKRKTVPPAPFGCMAGYYPKLIGTALAGVEGKSLPVMSNPRTHCPQWLLAGSLSTS
jgi:hypothetical protein